MKSAFIGHFSPKSKSSDLASSAAGNQVQMQIIKELNEQTEGKIICYAMKPEPVWPRGKLISKSFCEDSNEYIGYVNLPILKHLLFSIRLLTRLLCDNPKLCVQYNSYFFENIALLLFRLLSHKVFLVILIQDIHVEKSYFGFSLRYLRSISSKLSIRLSRYFNLILPISSTIIVDFKLDPKRCLVFQGGATEYAMELMRSQQAPSDDFGVFAGALEPYNGIDRLVNQWLRFGIENKLHVFGRGSLQSQIENTAKQSSRIVYHGLQSDETVFKWQLKARWNFCFRYSDGINQEYFFPSKLFNVMSAPGAVIVNNFHALPSNFREYIGVVADDLSDLPCVLMNSFEMQSMHRVEQRREIVRSAHSWKSCIKKIIQAAKLECDS